MKFINKNTSVIIRVLLGIFFIGSALTKLISIDDFEVFVYSFGILNLDLSFLFARLVISLELLIGIILIAGIYLRVVITATIAMIAMFIIFITYLMLFDNVRHCHCFGNFFEISNFWSIVKNIALIFLLLIIYHGSDSIFRYRKLIAISALVITTLVPLLFSPPDTFYYHQYSKNIPYDQLLLQSFLDEHPEFNEGKHILCFFGTGCKFCRLAAQKLTVIADKSNEADKVSCIFWGEEVAVKNFYLETMSHDFNYTLLPTDIFLRITKGEMPLIILLDNGILKGKHGYRSINEKQFIKFLSN